MILVMTKTRGIDPFPGDPWGGAPSYVREAARRKAKILKVWRLYMRRGWNRSALQYEMDRASELMDAAIDRWRHEEDNPPLF